MPSACLGTDGEHSFPANAQGLNVRMAKSSVRDPYIKYIFPVQYVLRRNLNSPILNPKILLCVSNVPIQELNSLLSLITQQMDLHLPEKALLVISSFLFLEL